MARPHFSGQFFSQNLINSKSGLPSWQNHVQTVDASRVREPETWRTAPLETKAESRIHPSWRPCCDMSPSWNRLLWNLKHGTSLYTPVCLQGIVPSLSRWSFLCRNCGHSSIEQASWGLFASENLQRLSDSGLKPPGDPCVKIDVCCVKKSVRIFFFSIRSWRLYPETLLR